MELFKPLTEIEAREIAAGVTTSPDIAKPECSHPPPSKKSAIHKKRPLSSKETSNPRGEQAERPPSPEQETSNPREASPEQVTSNPQGEQATAPSGPPSNDAEMDDTDGEIFSEDDYPIFSEDDSPAPSPTTMRDMEPPAPKRSRVDLAAFVDEEDQADQVPQGSCFCKDGDVQVCPFRHSNFTLLACSIIKIPDRHAELQVQLLSCQMTHRMKTSRAIPDTVAITRTVPYSDACREMVLAASAEYTLVSFTKTLGMDFEAIKKLSHELLCCNLAAVLEPLGSEQREVKTYLIAYRSHKKLPAAIQASDLNFGKLNSANEAFIWITCFQN